MVGKNLIRRLVQPGSDLLNEIPDVEAEGTCAGTGRRFLREAIVLSVYHRDNIHNPAPSICLICRADDPMKSRER
jgi:hypothetical protein